jgi:cysteine desulfurase
MTEESKVNIDARGKRCPRPIIELAKAKRRNTVGTIIEIVADDLAFETDVRAWCETTNNQLLDMKKAGKEVTAVIEICHTGGD